MIVDLKDVSLRAKRCRSDPNPLAKVNFIQSRFTMESHTDGSKDVDLVSQEIRLHDLRFIGKTTNQFESGLAVWIELVSFDRGTPKPAIERFHEHPPAPEERRTFVWCTRPRRKLPLENEDASGSAL